MKLKDFIDEDYTPGLKFTKKEKQLINQGLRMVENLINDSAVKDCMRKVKRLPEIEGLREQGSEVE